MKIKISETTPPQLDWLVAKCEGVTVRWSAPHEQLLVVGKPYVPFVAHRDWGLCGPILERERISVSHSIEGDWMGYYTIDFDMQSVSRGPTPLIAAMRCYVASKLGDEVDIPEELV